MSFSSEFKEFALKGNVMDLAIGVIIGAAFAKIVDSLVNDIIMPIVGLVVGPQGFANSYIPLSDAVKKAHADNPNLSLVDARKIGNVLAWGNFLTNILDFFILALIIFIMIRAINKLGPRKTVVEVAA